jgi:two-component sensor histidine kinase
MVAPRQARNLALIVHELATNSLKYGALSVASGLLTIAWRCEEGQIVIDWIEEGRNSAGYQESSCGFGTKLIDVMIRDLNGHIDRQPTETGFVCQIVLPTKSGDVAPAEQAAAAAPGL